MKKIVLLATLVGAALVYACQKETAPSFDTVQADLAVSSRGDSLHCDSLHHPHDSTWHHLPDSLHHPHDSTGHHHPIDSMWHHLPDTLHHPHPDTTGVPGGGHGGGKGGGKGGHGGHGG